MIVTIAGLTGCGKNTVGDLVAKKLSLRRIDFTFKDAAMKRGISLMDFQKLAEKDASIDKQMDEMIVKEASKGDAVVTTWLAAWMVKNADLRIWLKASAKERARRIAGRDKMSEKDALKHVNERDESNRKRYKEYYSIDIDDHSIFDLELNTERFEPETTAEIVVETAERMKPLKFEMG